MENETIFVNLVYLLARRMYAALKKSCLGSMISRSRKLSFLIGSKLLNF